MKLFELVDRYFKRKALERLRQRYVILDEQANKTMLVIPIMEWTHAEKLNVMKSLMDKSKRYQEQISDLETQIKAL